jgi:hypothetical protein
MFRRAGQMALALALAGCTKEVVLNDVRDSGFNDAATVPRDPWQWSDASCTGGTPIKYTPQTAQVLILFDRSASMYSNFGSTSTPRAELAQNALADAVTTYTSRIKFGLEVFPSDPMRSQCPQGTCCADPVSVGPAAYNASRVNNSIQCSDAHGYGCQIASSDSPSNAALARARDYYSALNPPTSDNLYVLLVTASEPSCSADSHDTTCSNALSAASDLGKLPVRIIVLSVDYQPKHNSCLSQIPLNGSLDLPPNVQSLYPTTSPSDLSTALTGLFDAIAKYACTLSSLPLIPPNTDLTVSIGQDTVSPIVNANDQDGWRCTNPSCTGIKLVGSACDQWVKPPQMSNLDVSYACSWCGGPTPCSSWGP